VAAGQQFVLRQLGAMSSKFRSQNHFKVSVRHPESTKNRARRVFATVCFLLISSHLLALEAAARKKRFPVFFDPTLLDLSLILAPPPPDNTARGKADLDEVGKATLNGSAHASGVARTRCLF
jgi:hypothetical protein